MTDQDPDLKARFDQLAGDMSDAVDTEDRLQQLHRRGSRSLPTVALSLAAAVVVLLGLVGGLAFVNDRGTTVEAGTDRQPAEPVASDPDPEECGAAGYYVYQQPGTVESVAVAAMIEAQPEVIAHRYFDVDETYDEFADLFADQPDFVAAVSSGDLPTSWRVVLREPWTPETITSIRQLPDVYSVETVSTSDEGCISVDSFAGPSHGEELQPLQGSEEHSDSTTTTAPPVPSGP